MKDKYNREQRAESREQRAIRRLGDRETMRLSELERERLVSETTETIRTIINNKQHSINYKPHQLTLRGLKYSSSCLPQEGFNSGVCPAAAAITKKRSTYSSPRATLSSELHLKCSTSPETGYYHNKEPGHNDWEGMPM
jgi:hypothetical protein